jgi:hypothetical protein
LAVCGDSVRQSTEECDPTAPGGDSACPDACILPAALGQCTCARPSLDPRAYVVVATTQAKLATDATVGSGHVGVVAAGGFLLVGKSAFTGSQLQVIADKSKLLTEARVGRLFSNNALMRGSAATVSGGPFGFVPPLPLLGSLPAFPVANPGTTPVDVLPGDIVALPPGGYTTVLVGAGATLVLHGLSPGSAAGRYDMRSLMLVSDARVLIDNPVVVNISERFGFSGGSIAGHSTFGPAEAAPLRAGDIQVNVGGSARIGGGATLTAYVRAPSGSIRVGKNALVSGRLIGAKVLIGRGTTLFNQGSCGDGTFEPGEECDASAPGGACPGACIAAGQPGQCTCPCTVDANCDDHNACNGVEHCVGNICVVGIPPDCGDDNPCTRDCDAGLGCVNTPVPNGTSCSDANPCTGGDSCQSGLCTPGAALPDGTSCSDRDKCTLLDSCRSGVCVGGAPRDCADDNTCTADACDEIDGCRHTTLPDGEACSDSNACTTVDACQDGACIPFQRRNCDDGNPCTGDSCDAVLGCQHTTLPDGEVCGPNKTCGGGVCR